MSNNMELWSAVEKTDPAHTKQVTHRGGFTSIDAHYQIMMATKQFGPVGVGWGWSSSDPIYPPNGTVVIKCTLWHGTKDQTVEQFGQKNLNSGDKADEDAFKKAATDGLTKCLSYLGFNADVFLGRFDDNKYVQERRDEEAEAAKTPDQKEAERIREKINGAETPEEVAKAWADNKDEILALPDDFQSRLIEIHDERLSGLDTSSEQVPTGMDKSWLIEMQSGQAGPPNFTAFKDTFISILKTRENGDEITKLAEDNGPNLKALKAADIDGYQYLVEQTKFRRAFLAQQPLETE